MEYGNGKRISRAGRGRRPHSGRAGDVAGGGADGGAGRDDDGARTAGAEGLPGALAVDVSLAHVGYGWPLERVGHAFGVNRATAGVGCRWAEDARDDPAIDGLLDRLEATIRDVCEAPRLELAA